MQTAVLSYKLFRWENPVSALLPSGIPRLLSFHILSVSSLLGKIKRIRQNLDNITSSHVRTVMPDDIARPLVQFSPFPEKQLRNILRKTSRKLSDLDPLPVSRLCENIDLLLKNSPGSHKHHKQMIIIILVGECISIFPNQFKAPKQG